MNTIKKLFNGEIYPFEDMRDTKETLRVRNRLHNYLEKADENIPRENNTCFSDIIYEQISIIEARTAEQGFELGFSLGVRLMAECYRKK